MNGHIKTQLKTFALVAVPLSDGTGRGQGKGPIEGEKSFGLISQ